MSCVRAACSPSGEMFEETKAIKPLFLARTMAQLLISGVLVGLALLSSAGVCVEQSVAHDLHGQTTSARDRFSLPRIFDFERFKAQFNRHYESQSEELVRKKLFLGRAFRVFVAAVSYKHGRSHTFLAINHMSDWTPSEVKHSFISWRAKRGDIKKDVESNHVPVASIEDIEDVLAKIVQLQDVPGFEDMAAEVTGPAARMKRSIDRSHLSYDDLFRSSDEAETSKKVIGRPSSNNPDYEPPELVSFGSREMTTHTEPMSEEERSMVASLSGSDYVESVAREASSRVRKQNKDQRKASKADEMFVDHRRSGCLLVPKHQGACGSCYIFSTLALYEWLHCMITGKLVSFSEQYPLDCGGRVGMRGCSGGFEVDVSKFVAKYGLETRAHYPYVGKQGSCPYSNSTSPKRMGFLRINEPRLRTVNFERLEEVLESIPVLIGIATDESFLEYGGGVDRANGCKVHRAHAVLLVGWGREDGEEFWLIRNSHSSKWGEKGYYKLSKRARHCLLDGQGWTSRQALNFGTKMVIDANPNYERKLRN